MKDEIKEILAEIKDSINETPKRMFKYNKITFNLEESQLILDYITNLQEENERLNNIIDGLEKDLLELRLTDVSGKTIVYRLLDKLKELKEGE